MLCRLAGRAGIGVSVCALDAMSVTSATLRHSTRRRSGLPRLNPAASQPSDRRLGTACGLVAQAIQQQRDHPVRSGGVGAPGRWHAEVGDGAEEIQGRRARPDDPGALGGIEQSLQHGAGSVLEVGAKPREGGVPGMQRSRQPVLGGDELDGNLCTGLRRIPGRAPSLIATLSVGR